jgi:hypothetical protein
MATIDFTNNTRNADGRVNCVGFFNAGGDSFFNISEIELKLNELNDFLLNAISNESKENIKEHIEAAKSIKSKLQENFLRNKNFFVGGLTDIQIDFYYNRLTQ